jgi:hypothetical protein
MRTTPRSRAPRVRAHRLAHTAAAAAAVLLVAVASRDADARVVHAAAPANLPAELVGNWRYGRISPTNFWNDQTGTYAGNAYGMSDYYEIAAGGSYKRMTYIYTQAYNCRTQTWTEMEGTLTADAGRFTLAPAKGRYKVANNCAKSQNYTRPMTAAELKEKQGETWTWSRVQRDGRTVLAAGKTGRDEPVYYEQEP